jgi:hypothetical protein
VFHYDGLGVGEYGERVEGGTVGWGGWWGAWMEDEVDAVGGVVVC